MYCKILNSQIVEVRAVLPKQMRFADGGSTGNFDALPVAKQVDAGWYPLIEERPAFDARLEELTVGSIEIGSESVTRHWKAVAKDIEEIRSVVLGNITLHRDGLLAYSTLDYTHNGETHPIEVSPTASANITGQQVTLGTLAQLGMTPDVVAHACVDGHVMLLTPAEFTMMALTYAQHVKTLYDTSFTKRSEVAAIQDVKTLANYPVTEGW